MRAATVLAVALATISSFPLTAQKQDTPTQQQTVQQPPAAQRPSNPAANQTDPAQTNPPTDDSSKVAAVTLTPVSGELMGNLDAKSAKTGDGVVVKTKENVRTADGLEIPKGSKIVGTVTGVQARGGDAQNSQIAIKFDHAELKSGQSVAIASVIQSVAPAESSDRSGSSDYETPMGSPTPGMSMPSSGNPDANHDAMNGSLSNNWEGAHASLSPSQSARRPSTMSGPVPGTIVARSGNIAIRATAVPGVLIANNANGQPFASASSIVLGAQRDIHLDGGTQVVIALAPMPNHGSGGGMSR